MFDVDSSQMRAFADWPDQEVAAIRAPTLLVCGDRDVVRVEHVVAISRLISGARLLVLPAGHGDYLGEAFATSTPDLMEHTVPMLLRFLDEPA